MIALPSVGFRVAIWLWLNGYSSADNSSLPTGDLGKLWSGTEYSFAKLSMKIQQSNNGIESLFRYWRHALKVRLRLNVSTAHAVLTELYFCHKNLFYFSPPIYRYLTFHVHRKGADQDVQWTTEMAVAN